MSLTLKEKIAFLEQELLNLKNIEKDELVVDETYNFFINRYGITPELKSVNFNLPEDVSSGDKQFLIDGDIQSGKTKTLISFCVSSLAQKQKAVIIVRNFKEDCLQLMNSINAINKVHNAHLQDKGVSFEYKVCCSKNIQSWMFEKHSNILVLMANTTQLSAFAKIAVDNKFNNYSLFVDEADALLNTLQTNKEINVFNMMHIIYNQSRIAFLISATNYSNFFKDGTSPSRFIKVKQHPDYKGIEDVEFEILPVLVKQKKGTLFEKSPSLTHVLRTLTHRPTYKQHPTILLTKCTHLVMHQYEFIYTLSKSVEWKDRWAAIGYNGTGIVLYHHSFIKSDGLEINGVQGIKTENYPGVYTFKGIGIMKALTYLRMHGGKQVFPRIVVIAGHLASRCINFMDHDYQWHLTDEYLDPAVSMQCTDLIQSLRICGVHANETPLKVWCAEEVMENIVKTYYNLGGFIEQVVEKYKSGEGDSVEFKTLLSSVKFHKTKLGNRKVCKIKAPYKKVSNIKQDNTDEILGNNNVDKKVEENVFTEGKVIFIKEDELKNTMPTLYTDVVNIILTHKGTGTWVERSFIVNYLTGENTKNTANLVTMSRYGIEVGDETTTGLLMKKFKNIVYIRLN